MAARKHVVFNRSEGRAFIPRSNVEGKALPFNTDTKNAQHRFLLSHNPESWDFSDQYGFLPVVNQMRLKPGAGNVGADLNPSKLQRDAEERGAIVIHQGDPRLGEWKHYNIEWPVQGGGVCYEFIGAVPTGRPGNRVHWEPSPDWDEFRAHLVTEGIVPPPLDFVMETLIERQAYVVDRIRQKNVEGKRSNDDLKAAEARLDAMRECLASYQTESPEPEPEPAPKRKAPAVKMKGDK